VHLYTVCSGTNVLGAIGSVDIRILVFTSADLGLQKGPAWVPRGRRSRGPWGVGCGPGHCVVSLPFVSSSLEEPFHNGNSLQQPFRGNQMIVTFPGRTIMTTVMAVSELWSLCV
jgi:hypothetical protein